jgi:predicted nuclease with TOPRIM domain
MKKAIPYIIIIIITALSVYFYLDNKRDREDLKNKLEQKDKEVEIARDSIKIHESKISDLNDSIKQKDIVVVNLNKSEENAKRRAKNANYKYKELVRMIPINVKDSLLNYQDREVVLLDENKGLNKALVLCDSVKTIQVNIIEDFKGIITSKDLQAKQREKIIKNRGEAIEILYKDNKTQRRKGRKEGAIIGVLFTILAFLAI